MVRKVGHAPAWRVCRTCTPNKDDDLSKKQALWAVQNCLPLYLAEPDRKADNMKMAIGMALNYYLMDELVQLAELPIEIINLVTLTEET
jgi:hypothetical protein